MDLSKTQKNSSSIDEDFKKNYLKLVPLANLPKEPKDGDSSTSNEEEEDEEEHDLASIFESSSTHPSNDANLESKPLNQEHFSYDWCIDKEILNEWQALISNTLLLMKESKDFNIEVGQKPELSLKSPAFQCGLMVDRCADWHLELRIVEHTLEDGDGTKQKYVGMFILMDKVDSWAVDELRPTTLNALINIQILDSARGIFTSAKTQMLTFGLQPHCIQYTCFPDLILWDEFLHVNSKLLGDDNCLKFRLKIDMFGNSEYKYQHTLKSTSKPKNSAVPYELLEEEKDGEDAYDDPVLKKCIKPGGIEKGMKQLLVSGEGADLSIVVNGKEILKIHGELIQTRAPLIMKYIDEQNKIHLDDFGKETIQILMEYLYTDKMKVPQQSLKPALINELLYAGELFEIKNLNQDVIKLLSSSIEMKDKPEKLGNGDWCKPLESVPSGTGNDAIDERYLIAMDEFAQKAKAEQVILSQEFAEILNKAQETFSKGTTDLEPKKQLELTENPSVNLNEKRGPTIVKPVIKKPEPLQMKPLATRKTIDFIEQNKKMLAHSSQKFPNYASKARIAPGLTKSDSTLRKTEPKNANSTLRKTESKNPINFLERNKAMVMPTKDRKIPESKVSKTNIPQSIAQPRSLARQSSINFVQQNKTITPVQRTPSFDSRSPTLKMVKKTESTTLRKSGSKNLVDYVKQNKLMVKPKDSADVAYEKLVEQTIKMSEAGTTFPKSSINFVAPPPPGNSSSTNGNKKDLKTSNKVQSNSDKAEISKMVDLIEKRKKINSLQSSSSDMAAGMKPTKGKPQ